MFNPNTIMRQRPIIVTPMVRLDSLGLHHAERLFALINSSRQHLRRWLPWVKDTKTVDDSVHFISDYCRPSSEQGTAFCYGIMVHNVLAGCFEIRWNDTRNYYDSPPERFAHLGYWLGSDFLGQGIMTHTVHAVTHDLFTTYGIEQIGIAVAMENFASQRLAERLGYTFEKILPHAETLADSTIVDHKLYLIDKA